MKKAVKQYLRQVKKNLCCPSSLARAFLHHLEDDVSLFCEGAESVTLSQISKEFGDPEDVASDFFTGLNAKAVSQYSYTRLKITYGILAVVLMIALCGVGVKLYEYVQNRVFLTNIQSGSPCGVWHPCYKMHIHEPYVCMPEGAENCTVIRLRTQRKERDYYWEYHSCIDRFYTIPEPVDWESLPPYAEDLYVTNDSVVTHWHFDEKRTGWYKVYDEE